MAKKKLLLTLALFVFLIPFVHAAQLYSPTWGFYIDLPESYQYIEGDGRDRFSFENTEGAKFDLVVYHAEPGRPAPYASLQELAFDVQNRLDNRGSITLFTYARKEAWLMELSFLLPNPGGRAIAMSGWALFFELAENASVSPQAGTPDSGQAGNRPLLAALAYGPADRPGLMDFHLSALDSIIPEESVKRSPGPITEFAYPRERRIEVPVFALNAMVTIYDEETDAAQYLVDREFQVLSRYADTPYWREAWKRFYRAIYRDSFERLAGIAFQVERVMNVPARENRDFAEQVLKWVQSFNYERDFMGSDFINLVSAATEGRGDCDSRAMLWAVILNHSNIPAAIMVSRYYSHAMGLADLPGTGARFELEGKSFLVAETTAPVPIGLIGGNVSDPAYWLGISFD